MTVTKPLSNLMFEGALFGATALLLWAGYLGSRARARGRQEEFIGSLIKMVQETIPEGQGGDFDAAKWVARWLENPQPALAGAAPRDYLDTAERRAIVKRLLGTIESGAYI